MEDIRTTGSIASSSRFLVQKIVDQIPFDAVSRLVEFGAGTGTITQGLLEQMNPRQELYAYEINDDFIKYLHDINDPRLHILNEDAAGVSQKFGKESIDIIVSSLPLKNMPAEIKNPILAAAYQALKPGGVFIQYQYSLGDFSLVKSYFEQTRLDFTPFNIPPAFIYFSRKT